LVPVVDLGLANADRAVLDPEEDVIGMLDARHRDIHDLESRFRGDLHQRLHVSIPS
jgi:hypothetical protein